jgi:hypothetical protein
MSTQLQREVYGPTPLTVQCTYSLTVNEMVKFEWLQNVSRGVELAQDYFDRDAAILKRESGIRAESAVEWRKIADYVFPTLVVVMMRSPFREDHDFNEHPRYVVVSRTGDAIDMYAENLYTLEADESGAPTEVESALNQLNAWSSKLEGTRKGEAMKHLRALHRVLGVRQ